MNNRVFGLWIGQDEQYAYDVCEWVHPGMVVLAEGAWTMAGGLADRYPDIEIILRDTYQRWGGDNAINSAINTNPLETGRALAGEMLTNTAPSRELLKQKGRRALLYSFNEPVLDNLEQVKNTVMAEAIFLGDCRTAGEDALIYNWATGTPGNIGLLQNFLGLAPNFIGPHLYHLRISDNYEEDKNWTALRYRMYPEWLKKVPILSTEIGFDQVGVGGWSRQGMREEDVITGLIALGKEWALDNVKGALFAVNSTNDEWKEKGFEYTETIYRALGILNLSLDTAEDPVGEIQPPDSPDEWEENKEGGEMTDSPVLPEIDTTWGIAQELKAEAFMLRDVAQRCDDLAGRIEDYLKIIKEKTTPKE